MKRRLRRWGSRGAASPWAAEECAWRAGTVRKNAIMVSLQNCNWIERIFMSMTLLFGWKSQGRPLIACATHLSAPQCERCAGLLHLNRRVLENDVREHSSVRCRGQVRTETDAHIERFVEVERDWRAKPGHGVPLKTDKNRNGIALLFDSDTLRFDPRENAPEAKLGVLHHRALIRTPRHVDHAHPMLADHGFPGIVIKTLANDQDRLTVAVALRIWKRDVGRE